MSIQFVKYVTFNYLPNLIILILKYFINIINMFACNNFLNLTTLLLILDTRKNLI